MKLKKLWTTWKYAVGSFSDEQTEEYDDIVAIVRTCAFFIMANIIHNW